MKRLSMLIALMTSGAVIAAQPAPAVKDADAIIKRMEDSGALDRAVDRAIERYLARQQEAQRKQQDALVQQSAMAKNARNPDTARDHVFGAPRADVTIIEYSDFECPYCRSFHGVPQAVVRRLAGKVNMVWRHLPLDFHNPAAQKEAEASVCAAKIGGNDAFWKYTDAIMARTVGGGKGLPATDGDPLLALAKELKLDPASFQKCIETGAGKQQIAEDQRDAMNAGVNGTPGVIIRNNKTGKSVVMVGAVPVDALELQVREILSAQ